MPKGTERRLSNTLSASPDPRDRRNTPVGNRARALRASAGAVLAIVAGLLVGPATSAGAEEAEVFAAQGAWFWSSNSKVTTCASVNPSTGVCTAASVDDGANFSGIGATPSGALSPISTGHLAVSLKNGSSDMRSYLKFDLGELPFGIEFGKFEMILTMSQPTDTPHAEQHTTFEGKAPATSNPGSASIVACSVTIPWGPAEGDPTASTTILPPDPEQGREDFEITTSRDEPLYDCSNQALGVSSVDGTSWRFDLTAMANKWASLELFNEGIALLPVNQNVLSTWTVEFHGPPLTVRTDDASTVVVPKELGARADVSFAEVPPDETPTQGPSGPEGPAGPSGPTIIQPGDGGTTTPPADGQPTLGGAITRVGKAGSPETPAWLYGLIPLGLLGLGLTSSAVGAEAGGAGAPNRVAQVLRQRRLLDDGSPSSTEPTA